MSKDQPKTFNTDTFVREPVSGLSKANLFVEPELNIILDSDDKSDSSYEAPKRNLLIQN